MLNSKVSIIVPAYNCDEFLAETLDSVLTQTYQDWECIIVNDGSTDHTAEIINHFCKQDQRFKHLSQTNQGVSVARNNGIKFSHGDIILPLDGDDVIGPTYLEKAIQYFVNHPDTKLVYCQAAFCGEKEGRWDLPTYNYNHILWDNMIFNAALYRRIDYDKTLGYNPNMVDGLEDWDFWITLLNPQDKVHRIEEVLFYYRIKPESRNINNTENHINGMHRQIVKNHLDKYTPFVEDIINMKRELDLRQEELDYCQKELNSLRSSREYHLGKKIYSTLHKLKHSLHK